MAFFDSFYSFSSAQHPSALHVDSSDKTDERMKDPYAITLGLEHHIEPLEFNVMIGRKPMDLVTTSLVVLYLVSDRIIQAFTDVGITGWSTYPVMLWDKRGNEIPGYHGLTVTGRSGPIDDSRSVRMLRDPATDPTVDAGAPYWAWVGLFFKEESWDGSDIFIAKNPTEISGYMIVNTRVRDLLINMKATNILLRPLPRVERRMLDTGEFAMPRDSTWEF